MALPKFYVEDKVVYNKVVGVVTAVSRERDWPTVGRVRKVWIIQPGKAEFWVWDFQLEAW